MEKASSSKRTPSLVSLHLLISIFIWAQDFLSRSWSSLQFQLNFGDSNVWAENNNNEVELSQQQTCSSEKKNKGSLSRGDAEMVMQKLGFFCSPEGEELQEWFSSNEISGLFDEKEPSLEEVKEAFDVFDENRDGFIDAGELQRVLCILGLKEGKLMENCKKMIRKFDENRDGKIDFNEFVKFMESSFC